MTMERQSCRRKKENGKRFYGIVNTKKKKFLHVLPIHVKQNTHSYLTTFEA